jgi:hypothetical protein
MPKRKCVVYNTVLGDGLGDFTHFEDTMRALRANPKFQDIEFVAFVEFRDRPNLSKEQNDAVYSNIRRRLDALGVQSFYGRPEEHQAYAKQEDVQQIFREAEQTISISNDEIRRRSGYAPLDANLPNKYIAEHEKKNPSYYPNTLDRPLGLSEGCYGLKLEDPPQTAPATAGQIIMENDPVFANQLLASTAATNFQEFNSNNHFIPAYFNKQEDFDMFLNIVASNPSLTHGKNIVIYYSGNTADLESTLRKFKVPQISSIELVEPSVASSSEVSTAPTTSKTIDNPTSTGSVQIKIFSGFRVATPSYDALYQLSNMAAVSGDNTFEHCISTNNFPFYRSTNHALDKGGKCATLTALCDITQSEDLDIPEDVKASYKLYFGSAYDEFKSLCNRVAEAQSSVDHNPNNSRAVRELAKAKVELEENNPYRDKMKDPDFDPDFDVNINFERMIEYWPVVTAHLRKHHNFYNNMEAIVQEGVPEASHEASLAEARDIRARFGRENRPEITHAAPSAAASAEENEEVTSTPPKGPGQE